MLTLSNVSIVVVNFMYQLGWAMVLYYLVKHYSGCFCEAFLDEINIYFCIIDYAKAFDRVYHNKL